MPWIEAELGVENQTLEGTKGAVYLEGLYDGMLLYANVINRSLEADEAGLLPNQSLRGTSVIGTSLGMSFAGRYIVKMERVESQKRKGLLNETRRSFP